MNWIKKIFSNKSKKQCTVPNVMRFYFVSFHGEGTGSIWFNYEGFLLTYGLKKK